MISNAEKWTIYRKYRNLYNRVLRKQKEQYYTSAFNQTKNPKKLWNLANEVTGRINKDASINFDQNDLKTAEAFNEHFSTVGNRQAQKIRDKSLEYQKYRPNLEWNEQTWMDFREVTIKEVETIIGSMAAKTSFSHDTVSNKIIKQVKKQISEPLTHLINTSLKLSYFPEEWKKAKVIPIFKSKDKKDVNNYRPISLLPTLSKVLEKVVAH